RWHYRIGPCETIYTRVTYNYFVALNRGKRRECNFRKPSGTRSPEIFFATPLRRGFWGFGFQVVKQPQGVTEATVAGTFGNGGAFATQSWADPKNHLIMVLMIQRAGFPNGANSSVLQAFQNAAEAAIVKQ
ncbi:MAG: hypothetical protein EXS25_02825, partial [Pedosphaera sp.]|nr:hypothetical protein [Pedosphaera sp.]